MAALLLAVAASVLVVLSGPFVGELNTSLQNAFPDQHLRIVVAVVVTPALIGLGAAVARIRELRLLRYGALAVAISVAVGYVALMTPSYTEQFHLTEYAVLTFLFYRVWRDRADVTTFVLPIAGGLIAGLADEWFQWFIPSRVGELRDVVLNGTGIMAGLLFAVALHPPAGIRLFAADGSRRLLAAGLGIVTVAVAVFLQCVHLGHEISDSDAGTFRSRYSAATLFDLSTERSRQWAAAPPLSGPRISREDHYLTEAMFHVQRRNNAGGAGFAGTQWREHLILEKFYAPVLTLPGMSWPPEQRANVEAAAVRSAANPSTADREYVGEPMPFPIYAWDPRWLWGTTLALLALFVVVARDRGRHALQSAAV